MPLAMPTTTNRITSPKIANVINVVVPRSQQMNRRELLKRRNLPKIGHKVFFKI
jgi:hypothetical protein